MKAINPIEQEINQIRLHIYEETKDMSPEELTEYYKKNTEAMIQKYGFKTVKSAKEVMT